ncbi:hypothetical protein QCA50_008314 [Cerrena zonata]|uniref:Uncharacterized protein n=1 Tax=Cerrena zonata TaxID=2478898 RepID=A0AAW0GC91_9APHY
MQGINRMGRKRKEHPKLAVTKPILNPIGTETISKRTCTVRAVGRPRTNDSLGCCVYIRCGKTCLCTIRKPWWKEVKRHRMRSRRHWGEASSSGCRKGNARRRQRPEFSVHPGKKIRMTRTTIRETNKFISVEIPGPKGRAEITGILSPASVPIAAFMLRAVLVCAHCHVRLLMRTPVRECLPCQGVEVRPQTLTWTARLQGGHKSRTFRTSSVKNLRFNESGELPSRHRMDESTQGEELGELRHIRTSSARTYATSAFLQYP